MIALQAGECSIFRSCPLLRDKKVFWPNGPLPGFGALGEMTRESGGASCTGMRAVHVQGGVAGQN